MSTANEMSTTTPAAVERLESLADVLASENEALKARDTTRMRRLLEEKQAALLACERWLDSDDAKGAGAAVADDAFTALRSRLDGLAEENQRRLRVAIAANQRLVESIAMAVQSQAPGGNANACDGRCEPAHARRAGPPPALSVNRAL
jgi:flagellar biosynthesis/type III secretory pathway chaperone